MSFIDPDKQLIVDEISSQKLNEKSKKAFIVGGCCSFMSQGSIISLTQPYPSVIYRLFDRI